MLQVGAPVVGSSGAAAELVKRLGLVQVGVRVVRVDVEGDIQGLHRGFGIPFLKVQTANLRPDFDVLMIALDGGVVPLQRPVAMTATLQAALKHLKRLPFPEFGEGDELADCQADLSELDGHIAGIAASLLGGGRADVHGLPEQLAELRQRLQSISNVPPADRDIAVQCRDYLDALEDVVQSMKR